MLYNARAMSEPTTHPPTSADPVTLREVTRENLNDVLALKVADSQRGLLTDNTTAIAEGHYHPESWFRAVYAGEVAVGFMMTTEKPEVPEYFLWRFMIGEAYQGMGFGSRAMEQLVERVRALPGATELRLGVIPRDDNAVGFYTRLGFVDTGEMEEGELRMSLAF